MTRQELSEQVLSSLYSVQAGVPPLTELNKINLLIDEFLQGTDTSVLALEIMKPSVNLRHLIERSSWTEDLLRIEAEKFVDLFYKKGGDPDRVRTHFINYIRKRKPNGKHGNGNQDNALRNWISSEDQ